MASMIARKWRRPWNKFRVITLGVAVDAIVPVDSVKQEGWKTSKKVPLDRLLDFEITVLDKFKAPVIAWVFASRVGYVQPHTATGEDGAGRAVA